MFQWYTLCFKPDSGLGGKIRIFLLGSPNVVQPSNCLNIHQIALFFLLTELALLPTLGFLKQRGGPQLFTWDPFEVQGHLNKVTRVWHLVLSDTLWQSASSWAVLRVSIPKQIVGSLVSPKRRKGSGALEVQIGVWNSQGGAKDKLFGLHSLVLVNYTTQFKLCTRDYTTAMYPAWLQFLLPENLLTNPDIVECIALESILKDLFIVKL